MVVAASAHKICPTIGIAVNGSTTIGVAAVGNAATGALLQSWPGSLLLGVRPVAGQRSHCGKGWLRSPSIRVCCFPRGSSIRCACTEEVQRRDDQSQGNSSAARTRREALLIAALPFIALPVLPAHGEEI